MCPHTYANPSYLWDVLAYRRADQVVHLLRDAHSGAADLGGGGEEGKRERGEEGKRGRGKVYLKVAERWQRGAPWREVEAGAEDGAPEGVAEGVAERWQRGAHHPCHPNRDCRFTHVPIGAVVALAHPLHQLGQLETATANTQDGDQILGGGRGEIWSDLDLHIDQAA